MSKLLDTQYKLLYEKERRFAKNVVYLIRAWKKRPWWHMCIPFKFLFEYRALKKDIRNFSARHVALKQIALSAAYRSAVKTNREASREEMHAQLRDACLHILKITSKEAYDLLRQWSDLLFQHYDRLFQIPERDYPKLIRQAYTSSGEYRSFLDQLNSLEQGISQAVHGPPGAGEADPSIRLEQKAVQDLRARELNDIFPA